MIMCLKQSWLSFPTGGIQIVNMKPHMTDSEILLFNKILDESTIYYEFGCGGSTNVALNKKNITKVYSIDTDKNWLNKFDHPKLHKTYIDVGETEDFGNPVNESKIDNWKLYSASIDEISDEPDTVFIDGRFRVACGVKTWFNVSEKTNVLIHDFTGRTHYHELLNLYDIKATCEQLVLLSKKASTVDLNEMYDRYKHDIR